MKATLVRGIENMRGDAALYKLAGDGGATEYVVVSAVNVPFSGPETYIFKANSVGAILDWTELEGSYQGGLDHNKALEGAGHTLATVVGGSE